MNFDLKYPAARIFLAIHKHDMILDVGVENLNLLSEYDQFSPKYDEQAWHVVLLDNVIHGWVTDVVIGEFASGILVSKWSSFATIQDSQVFHAPATFEARRTW